MNGNCTAKPIIVSLIGLERKRNFNYKIQLKIHFLRVQFSFVPRNEFYQILTPFLMESQFDKWLESRTEPTDEEKKKKTRKRKRNIVEAPDFLKRVG